MRSRSHFVPRRGLKLSVALTLLFLATSLSQTTSAATVSGVIRDASDSTAIGFASVTASPSGYSVSANLDGGYRVLLPPGDYEIKFSHVAHYSEIIKLTVGDSAITRDIYLKPALVEVSPINVWDRQYDAAQRIIIEAIKRKDAILSQIQQYSFEAYLKASARDTSKADSVSYLGLLESQIQAFWRYPDKHKEIITRRRQSANVSAEWNFLSVGELLNFNQNRIDLGRYVVVSPTATDALDYYDYYLIDTTLIDGRTVFVLEIEPKNDTDPLFAGEIKIVDSSYAVVGVDVTFSEGYDDPYSSNEHYRQIYSEFDGKYWMPTLIQFSALWDLRSLAFLLPVIAIDYQAAIHSYDFSADLSDTLFDEYALEVDRAADAVDTATWNDGQLMPLTSLEQRGYDYLDSVVNNPTSWDRFAGITGKTLGFATKAFSFNRVEGPALGWWHHFSGIADRLDLGLNAGYAFDAELWQYSVNAYYLADRKRRLSLDLRIHDVVRTRPVLFSYSRRHKSLIALANKTDADDYFLEKGFSAGLRTKLWNRTGLSITYNDFDQQPLENITEYSFFRETKMNRINPPIVSGRLRSVSARFFYNSSKLWKDKGRDIQVLTLSHYSFGFGVEYASDNLIENDFEFVQYNISFRCTQRVFGWAINRVYAYAGASDKTLPPQRYYVVNFDANLFDDAIIFHTLDETNFCGSRVVALYTHNSLGRKLFQKSGLPLVRDLPFTLNLYGGVFWTDLKGNPLQPGDDLVHVALTAYSEIGFSLGRLLPLGLIPTFTWQLSDYDTKRFAFGITASMF